MQGYLVSAAGSLCLLYGCATPTPEAVAAAGAGPQPSEQETLNCRIEGLLFQDLARLRDAGQPAQAAANRVNTQYQGLVSSMDQRSAVEFALARRSDSAKFVYAHPALQPATLRYVGSSACLLGVAGDHDPRKPLTLAKSAEGCQKQYAAPSAETQLKNCIANESAGLLAP